MRIGKDDANGLLLGQPLVRRHLFAPVGGQRLTARRWHVPAFLCEALVRMFSIRSIHLGQQDQAHRSLRPGADRRAIVSALEEIAFTVAKVLARLATPTGRSPMGRHIGELVPSIRASSPRPSGLACLTEYGQQFAAQGTTRQHIQCRIDRLCREVLPHVGRRRASEKVWPSARASSLGPGGFGHTARATDPAVCAAAAADTLEWPPGVCAVQAR